ncbi:formate dehydrogenase subunit gamma [Escherichia coli]|nr:formate dehydrogenase subunit gamma [Escherichia coli]
MALSGISFFFPTLQWLTQTFGTPQMGRILHPFFGIAIFVALMFMFVRFVHHNIPDKKDIPWLLNIVEVLKAMSTKWRMSVSTTPGKDDVLVNHEHDFRAAGDRVIIWRPYFAQYFPIQVVRYSLLIHAAAGIILIHAILIHMYMAFWVKGSIKGMIEGKVSRRWAKKHHPRWYREIEKAEAKKRVKKGYNLFEL